MDSNKENLEPLYQVLPIEGKGVGCIATRKMKMGTLITKEITQFVVPERTGKSVYTSKLMECFKKMSDYDQEQFLKVHTGFNSDDKPLKYLNTGLVFLK